MVASLGRHACNVHFKYAFSFFSKFFIPFRYHSHPGFGCWLSGVDINTQQSFEALSDRAVAVVIDPIQSVKGKVGQGYMMFSLLLKYWIQYMRIFCPNGKFKIMLPTI